MSNRRAMLRQLAQSYIYVLTSASLIPLDADAQSTPMLDESESEAKFAQYAAAAPGPQKCANCKFFSAAPEPNTGYCKKIPGKRVYADGVCKKFYLPK